MLCQRRASASADAVLVHIGVLVVPHACLPLLEPVVCIIAVICCVGLQEWVQQQEAIKNETLEIVYSYWDGSGHRRKVRRAHAGCEVAAAAAGDTMHLLMTSPFYRRPLRA
jgi:hypothetical protein